MNCGLGLHQRLERESAYAAQKEADRRQERRVIIERLERKIQLNPQQIEIVVGALLAQDTLED